MADDFDWADFKITKLRRRVAVLEALAGIFSKRIKTVRDEWKDLGGRLKAVLEAKRGEKGEKGDKGDQGDEGRPPTPEEIQGAADDYIRRNPPEPGPMPEPKWEETKLCWIDPRTQKKIGRCVELRGPPGPGAMFMGGGGGSEIAHRDYRVTTNASGEAFIFLTNDGAAAGAALYPGIAYVTLGVHEVNPAQITAAMFTLSADNKTLTIHTRQVVTVTLPGTLPQVLGFQVNVVQPVSATVDARVTGN